LNEQPAAREIGVERCLEPSTPEGKIGSWQYSYILLFKVTLQFEAAEFEIIRHLREEYCCGAIECFTGKRRHGGLPR